MAASVVVLSRRRPPAVNDVARSGLFAAIVSAFIGLFTLLFTDWRTAQRDRKAALQRAHEAETAEGHWRAEFEQSVRDEVRADIERNREDIRTLRDENKSLRTEIAAVRVDNAEIAKDRDAWKQSYEALWYQHGELRAQYASVSTERTELLTKVGSLEAQVRAVRTQIDRHESACPPLKAKEEGS